jgi:hypothetical protein
MFLPGAGKKEIPGISTAAQDVTALKSVNDVLALKRAS